jgi:hypothetical protein
VGLPCTPSAGAVMDAYLAYVADKGPKVQAAAKEVVAGVRVYFSLALGPLLLYPHERAQYDDIVAEQPDADIAAIYGAQHLLRLFGWLEGGFFYGWFFLFILKRWLIFFSCSQAAGSAREHGPYGAGRQRGALRACGPLAVHAEAAHGLLPAHRIRRRKVCFLVVCSCVCVFAF